MRIKNVAYWAMLIFLALVFLMAGAGMLAQMEVWQDRFVNQWGLPAWMVPVTGVAEITGAVLLLVPRLTIAGAAIIAAIMLGATGTHIAAGEWSRIVVTALFGTMAAQVMRWSSDRARAAASPSTER